MYIEKWKRAGKTIRRRVVRAPDYPVGSRERAEVRFHSDAAKTMWQVPAGFRRSRNALYRAKSRQRLRRHLACAVDLIPDVSGESSWDGFFTDRFIQDARYYWW
jgi:hypothetical protein